MANNVVDNVLKFLERQEMVVWKLGADALMVCTGFDGIGVDILIYFYEGKKVVNIDGANFIEIPQKKYDDIYKVLNECNAMHTFVKYVLDIEEGQINISARIEIQDDKCGAQCYVAMQLMLDCLQEAYPKFKEAIEEE